MLDLLLSAEQKGQIDDEGIKEEVSIFVFGVIQSTALDLPFLQ